jgi:PBSX family phage portal protein
MAQAPIVRVFKTTATPVENEAIKALKSFEGSHAIEDPFKEAYTTQAAGGSIAALSPPYNPNALSALVVENFMLAQCIQAMVVNVVGHGYQWEYVGPDGSDPSAEEAVAEQAKLDGLVSRPNLDGSWGELVEASWNDYETTGAFYWEIGRDTKQRVTAIDHLPAHSMRMTDRDAVATPVDAELPRDGKPTKMTAKKRFRRYVQQFGSKRVYFKEFGDPRRINPETGVVDENLSELDAATEVFCFKRYNPRSLYGLPRWIAQAPSIIGSRQAELTNMDFFSENAIPAMALLVSGGMVTQDAINQIDDAITNARGRASMNRVAIIEVAGDPNNAPENGTIAPPKVELKPLSGERMQEGQFLKYIEICGLNIRSAFRLPPMFVGLSEDLNYASAKVGFEVAESQVFAPERTKFDDFINMHILAAWGPKFWRYRSLPARISDPDDVVKALETFDKMGAMTPNIAIRLANQYFSLDLPEITEEWGNWPFVIVSQLATAGKLAGLDELMSDEAKAAIQAGLEAAQNLSAGGDQPDNPDQPNQPNKPDGEAGDDKEAQAKFEKQIAGRLIRRVADLVSVGHREVA